jgi:hypothetical protein
MHHAWRLCMRLMVHGVSYLKYVPSMEVALPYILHQKDCFEAISVVPFRLPCVMHVLLLLGLPYIHTYICIHSSILPYRTWSLSISSSTLSALPKSTLEELLYKMNRWLETANTIRFCSVWLALPYCTGKGKGNVSLSLWTGNIFSLYFSSIANHSGLLLY